MLWFYLGFSSESIFWFSGWRIIMNCWKSWFFSSAWVATDSTSPLLKDFASTIPGHGGIMDRFDCQYLMATFTHVYIASFIRWVEGRRLAGCGGIMSFFNEVTRADWIISAVLRISNRCLAGAQTRANCCNSCWCFSLNSSSPFSTRCSITWERGTYCPLLPSDRCRLRSGRWLCVAMPCKLNVSMYKHTGAHTHTLGKARCVNSGLPQRFHHHPAGCLFDFQPLQWPWPWRDYMELLHTHNKSYS